jgi:hypothetical protein
MLCGLAVPGLLLSAPVPGAAVRGQFIRVESGDRHEYLHFAEVEVYVGGRNIAVGRPVKASSTMQPFTPDKAVDGRIEYTWGVDPSFWSSAGNRGGEWWEVDLGAEVSIERVLLYNRSDCCQERLQGAVLTVLAGDRSVASGTTMEATANPNEIEFVPPTYAPVNVTAVPLVTRIDAISPRFDKPSDDTAYVMPVGAGDLSAMLRYGSAYEIHLSKCDLFGRPADTYGGDFNIMSPGHVQLSFGLAPDAITRFEQRLDFRRGSVVLTLTTAGGVVTVEAFGVMGQNVLVLAVEDMRPAGQATATFSAWRSAVTLTAENGIVTAREVHNGDESGKPVTDPAKANPNDRLYHLGAGTVVAFANATGLLTATGETGSDETGTTATLRAQPGRQYWVLIACATTYDGKPETAARLRLEATARADKAGLLSTHLEWWKGFWQSSYLDLYGKDAEYLMRLWYTTLYSYASVGEGAVLPKFNGGPGLVHRDDRHWGSDYWWQNTRELIWPMFAANHLRFAREHLDFYDRTFMDYKRQTAAQGKVGIRVWEGARPLKPGTVSPPRTVSTFDQTALAAAQANLTMEQAKSGYNARSMAQVAELVQLMLDYVAFTGDADYLMTVAAPWLKEAVLFYLSYLKLEGDGLYHMTPSDALEMWWQVKDPMTDMCAVRYCFWQALNHGAEFGYEPALLATIRERLSKLAPLPTGRWKRRPATKDEVPPGRPSYVGQMVGEIERSEAQYAAAADFLADRCVYNAEQPELYVIYPFALADANSPADDCERAVNTFKARQDPNAYGWSQDGIQAARLRLPNTIDVIMDHARRHQRYPYGGWVNAAVPLRGSKLNLSDVPYFDTAGVNMTALQEALLQSHVLSTPAKTDPQAGGPLVLLPAVRRDWAGRFRLRARGGFLVTAVFQPNRVIVRLTIESERGGALTFANPFPRCRVAGAGQGVLTSAERLVALPTQAGGTYDVSAE